MKKSEITATRDEFATPQLPKLEAPVRLTPEQLESVAAGFMSLPTTSAGGSGGGGSGGTMGMVSPEPVKTTKLF